MARCHTPPCPAPSCRQRGAVPGLPLCAADGPFRDEGYPARGGQLPGALGAGSAAPNAASGEQGWAAWAHGLAAAAGGGKGRGPLLLWRASLRWLHVPTCLPSTRMLQCTNIRGQSPCLQMAGSHPLPLSWPHLPLGFSPGPQYDRLLGNHEEPLTAVFPAASAVTHAANAALLRLCSALQLNREDERLLGERQIREAPKVRSRLAGRAVVASRAGPAPPRAARRALSAVAPLSHALIRP